MTDSSKLDGYLAGWLDAIWLFMSQEELDGFSQDLPSTVRRQLFGRGWLKPTGPAEGRERHVAITPLGVRTVVETCLDLGVERHFLGPDDEPIDPAQWLAEQRAKR